ncbi:hypothetical protein SAMN05444486_1011269 [Lentibacter algarum]|uniref:Uncharacterized protein n=1 Tax=Lentibacter algarum TaxID=576131 RepID=A0A1H3IVC0_9RHOB|nr:hypothetical protein [Lentibacter algarum]SDY31118.1 hypothetical protein SAMN05444486_1011269 [Lentibacter algarum]
MSDHLEACRAGSLFGFNDFNGLDRERFGGQVGSLREFFKQSCANEFAFNMGIMMAAMWHLTGMVVVGVKGYSSPSS